MHIPHYLFFRFRSFAECVGGDTIRERNSDELSEFEKHLAMSSAPAVNKRLASLLANINPPIAKCCFSRASHSLRLIDLPSSFFSFFFGADGGIRCGLVSPVERTVMFKSAGCKLVSSSTVLASSSIRFHLSLRAGNAGGELVRFLVPLVQLSFFC